MRNKRTAIDYAVEKTVHTIRILEALEGARFEPVTIDTIIERVGEIPELGTALRKDAVRRILLTLELCGWAVQNSNRQWAPGAKLLRFSNRYSELLISHR
ncbi:MAG: hypothetical protein IPN69_08090 [Acidobacteria bacterium]|nr:hypothetical protein [Acidobacteriota bacterium]